MTICKRVIVAGALLVSCVTGMPAQAAGPAAAAGAGPGPVAPRLNPKLNQLLIDEMIAINAASATILGALIGGDHSTVARQAQAIHDSFIMEKKLTPEDRDALEKALPPGFVLLDTMFHAKAAQLVSAAQRNDVELENYYFGRMIETCQACHSHFATDKFPAFVPAAAPARGEHGRK